MSLRLFRLPVLLAIGVLAGCSTDSITSAPATADVAQLRPNFSVTYKRADDPKLLRLLESEQRRVAKARKSEEARYNEVRREWRKLNRSYMRGRYDLLLCEPLPYDATTRIVGPRGGTLDFGPHELEIPIGALSGYTVITAEVPVSTSVSTRFSPHGTTFHVAPKLTLSYAHCNRPLTSVEHIVYTNGVEGEVLEVPPSSDDALNQRVYGWLSHFSIYALAE